MATPSGGNPAPVTDAGRAPKTAEPRPPGSGARPQPAGNGVQSAAERKGRPPTVAERLLEEGFCFDFFQAVRILERMYPERRAVGREGPPRNEVARFRARLSLSFPPSSIYELTPPTEQLPVPLLEVAFLGLYGP